MTITPYRQNVAESKILPSDANLTGFDKTITPYKQNVAELKILPSFV